MPRFSGVLTGLQLLQGAREKAAERQSAMGRTLIGAGYEPTARMPGWVSPSQIQAGQRADVGKILEMLMRGKVSAPGVVPGVRAGMPPEELAPTPSVTYTPPGLGISVKMPGVTYTEARMTRKEKKELEQSKRLAKSLLKGEYKTYDNVSKKWTKIPKPTTQEEAYWVLARWGIEPMDYWDEIMKLPPQSERLGKPVSAWDPRRLGPGYARESAFSAEIPPEFMGVAPTGLPTDLPDPKQYKENTIIRDEETGRRFQIQNGIWVEIE